MLQNHFQLLQGKPHPMKEHQDKETNMSHDVAMDQVSIPIAKFLDCNGIPDSRIQQASLVKKVKATGAYVTLLDAMALEGRIGNVRTDVCKWSKMIQATILQDVCG
jgi:hypothetical protein